MFPGVSIPGSDLTNPRFASPADYLDRRARVNIPTSRKQPPLSKTNSKVHGREEKRQTEIPNNIPKVELHKYPSG